MGRRFRQLPSTQIVNEVNVEEEEADIYDAYPRRRTRWHRGFLHPFVIRTGLAIILICLVIFGVQMMVYGIAHQKEFVANATAFMRDAFTFSHVFMYCLIVVVVVGTLRFCGLTPMNAIRFVRAVRDLLKPPARVHSFNQNMIAYTGDVTVHDYPRSGRVTGIEEQEEEVPLLPEHAASISNSPNRLNFADNWQPDPDELLSGRGTVFGIAGSGKSNTIADVVEEFGPLGVPLLLLDTEDEYQSLADRRYLLAGELVDSRHVGPENAREYGYCLMEERMQLIVNLASYDRSDDAALTIVGMLDGMRIWEEERPNGERMTSMTILDEAAIWLPQSARDSALSDDVLNQLYQMVFGVLVKRGRKRGMGFILATQRVAEINKKALQSNWRILHRQMELTDLEVYRKFGVTPEEAIALADGEAFIWTGRTSKLRVQMRKRYTRHESETPGLSSLRNVSPKSETTLSFPENSRNAFRQPEKPFRDISEFSERTISGQELPNRVVSEIPKSGQVPPEMREKITRLYRNGMTARTKIRDRLQLNGDEYWMVKTVMDELEA